MALKRDIAEATFTRGSEVVKDSPGDVIDVPLDARQLICTMQYSETGSTVDTRDDAVYLEVQISYNNGRSWRLAIACTTHNARPRKNKTRMTHNLRRPGIPQKARLVVRTREQLRAGFALETR